MSWLCCFVAFISGGKSGIFSSRAVPKRLYDINNCNVVVICEWLCCNCLFNCPAPLSGYNSVKAVTLSYTTAFPVPRTVSGTCCYSEHLLKSEQMTSHLKTHGKGEILKAASCNEVLNFWIFSLKPSFCNMKVMSISWISFSLLIVNKVRQNFTERVRPQNLQRRFKFKLCVSSLTSPSLGELQTRYHED